MKKYSAALALALAAISATPPTAAKAEIAATIPIKVTPASVGDPGYAAIPVVIWAPSTGTGLPLVVISHGTGGGALSHVDTAQALAEAGFVVVAPMHPGDNFQDDSNVGKPAWFVDRSRHVSKVIDHMLSGWEGHARIAPGKIGIYGLSAGATTALITIGGEPDLARIAPHCAASPEFVCRIMAPQTVTTPPVWTHDARIAAAVIAAPGIGFAFEPAGLTKVRVPIQLWVGSADETVPFKSNAAIVQRLLPKPPEFHSVSDAVHLSFLAPCTPETPPFLCQDKPGFDRRAFHNSFNKSVIAFFRQQFRITPKAKP
ncbi:alpha/beta hydrolase family protein [Novosphingobium aquae]|uniref:Dienelactone hydrolase family protein n=1 Tax=Novosphingobium aquae TaxID=3133435 RepID=A0ABU8S9T0_9SPHN